MYNILKTSVPALSITYTAIVLYASVFNIIEGYPKEGFCRFLLELAGYLFVAVVADYFISQINFRTYIQYFVTETIILYPFMIGAAMAWNWFQSDWPVILWNSCIYFIVMCAIHYYFYYVSKKQADEMNKILKSR